PCGIGPELAVAAWRALKDQAGLAFCVIGDATTLRGDGATVVAVDDIAEAADVFGTALPVLDRPLSQPAVPGHPDAVHAPHIIDWIREGVALCRQGRARALVTAPIAKSVLYSAGFGFPGHTEYLAELCRDGDGPAPHPVMMLTAKNLRVVLATVHVPLREVADRLSLPALVETARITDTALRRDFAIARPRLVMAGLNPHAGEDGSLGREDIDILAPAVARLQDEGMDIRGPLPADTLFHDEARAGYDAVLCMYHDQGLIPLKTLDFWGGVNITLGLPIVRTSPDHGTGFGIAGTGVARVDSLIAAIRAADTISRNRTACEAAA
ncbi:MAG: 4-hydroxythreonine-4-phosphate dehydrogenase PdxA, partial [Asticcacaulis sp.]|nr:4-hydroxythreonine-4-phosphate dehydrogenase PdxA [Asticcacaulis sp.]